MRFAAVTCAVLLVLGHADAARRARQSRRNSRHESVAASPPLPPPSPPSPHPPPPPAPTMNGLTAARSVGCEDVPNWTDLDGNTCGEYQANGWCRGSYLMPGFESKNEDNERHGPVSSCCECGKGRGGCLQARLDQYCIESGAGVAARKVGMNWNCYGALGSRKRLHCVGTSGWSESCVEGLEPAVQGSTHDDAIHERLREGCISKEEQDRRKAQRTADRRNHQQQGSEHHFERSYGSCMQQAMDEVCSTTFAPGAVSRRYWSNYLCCSKTLPEGGDGEEALGCVDEAGYFVACPPCDMSDAGNYLDMSTELRRVMWNGCRSSRAREEQAAWSDAGREEVKAMTGSAGPHLLHEVSPVVALLAATIGLSMLVAAHGLRRARGRVNGDCSPAPHAGVAGAAVSAWLPSMPGSRSSSIVPLDASRPRSRRGHINTAATSVVGEAQAGALESGGEYSHHQHLCPASTSNGDGGTCGIRAGSTAPPTVLAGML
mmetsp:Transcript_12705/g.38299  ORF Transcript_12705/g.38299 Transcript_12705/m.38299 type:complete len:489 (+) Transcript_12705:1962-3428(+)